MADSTLFNRYKQYKEGTARLVGWLANTAHACEDATGILPSLNAAKSAARQQNKKQKHSPEISTKVTVTTAQLIHLAKAVVSASVPVPMSILRTTRAVIAGRQVCADLYTSLSDSSIQEQNRSHQHFIDVLKQILRILETAPSPIAPARSQPGAPQDHATSQEDSEREGDITNLFACLTVDEPTENALGSAPGPAIPRTRGKQITFELDESETARHERSFAIWCLLQDLRDLRREVQKAWVGHKSGKISFSTAAMVSTVAISLARFAENELAASYEEYCGYFSVLDSMNVGAAEIGKVVRSYSSEKNKPIQMAQEKFSSEDKAELLMSRAYFIIHAFFQLSILERALGGPIWDSPLNVFMGFHQFGAALEAIIPDLRLHDTHRISTMLMDEFLSGLVDVMQSPTATIPSIWMVTACQINMDIMDILGSSIEAGLEDFKQRLEADKASIHTFLKNWNLRDACKCPTSLVTEASDVRRILIEGAEDQYEKARTSIQTNAQVNGRDPPLPFNVHRACPVPTGGLIHISAAQTHLFGVRLCNFGAMVLSVAYLYRAALKSGALKKKWADMEFVIQTHSTKSRPFVLEPKEGTTSMAKCFGLALGVKLNAFRRGQRPRLPSSAFIEQHVRQLKTEWPLQRAIDAWQKDQTQGAALFVAAAIESMKSLAKAEIESGELKDIRDQYEKSGKLAPHQLLRGFQEVYISHEMDLKFDYVTFFFTCARVLDAVRKNFECCLMEIEKEYHADLSRAHELVYAILWDKLEGPGHGLGHQHSILPDAAKVVEWFIDHEGSKLSDLARAQSSGYAPPPSVPAPDDPLSSEQVPEDSEPSVWSGNWKGDEHVGRS